MKKILMIALIMMATISASAQNPVGRWSIQPKGGIGFATLTDFPDSRMTIAAQIGGEAEYQINDWLSVAGAMMFSLQGTGIKDNDFYEDQDYNLGYIQFPFVANFYVYKGLAFKAGLQPGFKIGDNYHRKEKGTGRKIDDDHYNAESFDLSLPLGVSYQFGHFVIDARYILGLTKVNGNEYDYAGTKRSCRNSVFIATFGYKFNL